jgi:hypothetical protein
MKHDQRPIPIALETDGVCSNIISTATISLHICKDSLSVREHGSELRPFALDMYGAMGDSAQQRLQQLVHRHGEASTMNVATRNGHGLQTVSVALQSTNARMTDPASSIRRAVAKLAPTCPLPIQD